MGYRQNFIATMARLYNNEQPSLICGQAQAAADSKADDARFLWDVAVQKYAAKMERVKRILNEE